MEDHEDHVVYNDIHHREGAQREVLQHEWRRDNTPVYLVEMPDARPDAVPSTAREAPPRRSRLSSIMGGNTFELPEHVDNALEEYVRKNMTGFRKSLSPEDLEVDSRRRSLKYLERGGDVLITPGNVSDKETSKEEIDTKENRTGVKRISAPTERSEQKNDVAPIVKRRPQPAEEPRRKKNSVRESSRERSQCFNNVITVLPVALETGPKGSPFEDNGRRKKSRMKVVLMIESAEDLSKTSTTSARGKKRKQESGSFRTSSREASKDNDPKTRKKRSAGDESLWSSKGSRQDDTAKTKRNSKPKSSYVGKEGNSFASTVGRSSDKRKPSRELSRQRSRERTVSSEIKGKNKRTSTSSEEVADKDFKGQSPATEKPVIPERVEGTEQSPPMRKGQTLSERSKSEEDKSLKSVKRVSFKDEDDDHPPNPYKGMSTTKIYRAEQSLFQNPHGQTAQAPDTSTGRDRQPGNKKEATATKYRKVENLPSGEKKKGNAPAAKSRGGDGEKTAGPIYAKAPKSKKDMYSMKRYHIQIPQKDQEETPFCVRFNVSDENNVDMTYDGPVKITHYYSTNKYT